MSDVLGSSLLDIDTLLGPSLLPSVNTNCNVNFIHKRDKNVEQLIRDLWEADFQKGTGFLTCRFLPGTARHFIN